MWQYNHLQQKELMHYGKKGMRWGSRKGRRQLSKLSGRDKKSISKEEALNFRRDVKGVNSGKAGNGLKFEIKPGGGLKDIQWFNSKNEKIGKDYANNVINQAHKEQMASLYTKSSVIVGAGIVGLILKTKMS